MRLLHISDWHLGATLGRIKRAPDHDRVLDEICEIAAGAHPHLIVHTGDLFDHARPAVEDLHRAVDALRRLSATAPVVVLAGNHDSPPLFDVFDRMLALGSHADFPAVRFLGRARPPSARGIVTYPGDDGEEIRLAPVPFIHPNTLLHLFEVPPERWTASYTDQVRIVQQSLADGLTAGYDPARHILIYAAHLHVAGAILARSERALHVSEHYATTTEDLPPVAYAAFGHIHKPQPLPGLVPGAYCGSPIPIDYGELDEDKRVILVEAVAGKAATITSVPLSGGRPLRRVEGTLDELEAAGDVGQCIVQAIVDTDTHLPDLADRLTGLWPTAALYDVTERCAAASVELATEPPSGAELATDDLFRSYLAEIGTPAADVDPMMRLFTALHTGIITGTPAAFDEEALFEFAPMGDTLGRPTADAARASADKASPS
jgi:exonuclease SbcD